MQETYHTIDDDNFLFKMRRYMCLNASGYGMSTPISRTCVVLIGSRHMFTAGDDATETLN